MFFRSLLFGYLGAVLAGLIVGVVGVVGAVMDATPASVAGTATPIGIAAGIMAFSLTWIRPLAARIGRGRTQRRQ